MMATDKEFETLVVAFERNTGTGSLKSANSTLVKLLRLMWAQINTNKQSGDVLHGELQKLDVDVALPLFASLDTPGVPDTPITITIEPDNITFELKDDDSSFTLIPLDVVAEAEVEGEAPVGVGAAEPEAAAEVVAEATVEAPGVRDADEASVIAAIEAVSPKRRRAKS